MDPKIYDVFISYSSKDRVWVSNYVQALQACGLSVWWDRSLLAGQSYHKDIQRALDQSHCVVTIWSKTAVDSQWVIAESEQAYKRGVIIPVSCTSARIPVPFSSLHTIDLSQWNGEIDDICFQQALFPIRNTLHGSSQRKHLGDTSNTKIWGVKKSFFLSLMLIIIAFSMFFLLKMLVTSPPNEKGDSSVDMTTVEKLKKPATTFLNKNNEIEKLPNVSHSFSNHEKDSLQENNQLSEQEKVADLKRLSDIDQLAKNIDATSARQAEELNLTWSYEQHQFTENNASHSPIFHEKEGNFLQRDQLLGQEKEALLKRLSDKDQITKNIGVTSAQLDNNNTNRSNSSSLHSHNGSKHSHSLPPDSGLNHQHDGQVVPTVKQGNYAKRYALLIGNEDDGSRQIINSFKGTRGLTSTLQKLNFDVVTLINFNKERILNSVKNIRNRLNPSEENVVLFYFSGNTVQVEGENYLIPYGSQIESWAAVPKKAVSASYILEQFSKNQATLKIMLLNVRRNDPFDNKLSGFGVQEGLAKLSPRDGTTTIAYSIEPGKWSEDHIAGEAGMFAKHLLKHISTPGIDVRELLARIRGDVFTETRGRQRPWFTYSGTGKRFCFAGCTPLTRPRIRPVLPP